MAPECTEQQHRARRLFVYSWAPKTTGLFREGTDHAPLVNYPKVMKTCARAKDQCFLGPKGSCACKLGLPKVLKHSAMGQGYRRRRTFGPDLWLVGWLEYRFVHVTCCNSGLCVHDFGARASAPWKIFCCLLKFLLKQCYKCRVGSTKSESRGLVGWLAPNPEAKVRSQRTTSPVPLVWRRVRARVRLYM